MVQLERHNIGKYALISDFQDLANLSIREEAALATNSFKDRLEGLNLRNNALTTMTGPGLSSLQKFFDCRCSVRHLQMRVFGLMDTIDPSRESIGNCI